MANLTVEDKILGRKEPLPPTELQLKAFTDETKYLVYAEGSDNEKVVSGVKVGRILSLENKEKITNGDLEIRASGLIIKRIVETDTETETDTNIETTPKPKRKKAK